jgi:glutamate--cysteine ligase
VTADTTSAATLSEADAEHLIRAICFKTGPPGKVGAELEWLVNDSANPLLPVPFDRVRDVLRSLERPGILPGAGLLTLEPGGQVELSTAPAPNLTDCVAAASGDLAVMRAAFAAAGLVLTGHGLDQARHSIRVLDLPRYAAMERFFDRRGPWGRVMMCSTASVQVCVDAGGDDQTPLGYPFRWRLLHALGPVLVAAFANSPLRRGRPTGWKCTRQLVWSRIDPGRTAAPAGAEPCPRPAADTDPRSDWVRYAMDADVLCLRGPNGRPWAVPEGLTFRDWLRGTGQGCTVQGSTGQCPPGPTADDLSYHLSTLFPPVRARGHLELRMIDAQAGDGWVVPVAVVAALTEDPAAAEAAMAAAEPLWHEFAGERHGPWLRAARDGLADPRLAKAAAGCFEAASAALDRSGTAPAITSAVAGFAERYVHRGRCPADDVLDSRVGLDGQVLASSATTTQMPTTPRSRHDHRRRH